jgi:DNA-binding CsgD family transcriptional regulator
MSGSAPELVTALEQGDRRRVTDTVMELLSRRLRPNVMVIEDVQWAGEATLDVIAYVGRRIRRTTGLLVLTYRDGEVDASHPLRSVIGQLPPANLARITLAPLSASAISTMLDGTDLEPEKVLSLTGGSPLFVSEVLEWGVDGIPPSIHDSVMARRARMSPGARRILDLASVMPGGAEHDLFVSIAAPTPAQEIECRRFLRIDGERWMFRHELARRAVEASLSPSLRRRLNRDVLAEIDGTADPAVVVHHAREACDTQALVEYAPIAARRAMEVESHREAFEHFEAVAPFLDQIAPEERASILMDRATTERRLGRASTDSLYQAIELYRIGGTEKQLAEALTLAIAHNLNTGQISEADACAREATEILESRPAGKELAWTLSQHARLRLLQHRTTESTTLADKAITIANTVDDDRSIIDATITRSFGMLPDDPIRYFAVLESCRERAEAAGYPEQEARALLNIALNAGDILGTAPQIDLWRRLHHTAQRHELLDMDKVATIGLGEALMQSGDWTHAESSIIDVITDADFDSANLPMAFSAFTTLGTIQARSGRSAATQSINRALSLADSIGQPQHVIRIAAVLAEQMWLTGIAPAETLQYVHDALDTAVSMRWRYSTGNIAWWLSLAGNLDVVPETIAPEYLLAIEGDTTGSAAIWEAKGFPYERAVVLMSGDEQRQIEALRSFTDLGASSPASRIRSQLRTAGVRVPRQESKSTREHSAGLTARQAQVLELLGEGLTSPQMADHLFISRRTVESHVAAILLKLEASDRVAAVEIARRRGLLINL